MDLKNRKTQIEIFVTVAVIILGVWYFLGGKKESGAYLAEVAEDPVETIVGRELLSSLEKMKSVSLDVSLFNEPAYKSLQDTAVEVPKQPIGRRNPFAPFGQ